MTMNEPNPANQSIRPQPFGGRQGPPPSSSSGPEPELARLLGCGERFFRLYAMVYPVHFCLVAQIAGSLDSRAVAAAFQQIRWRHPALRVGIVDHAETGPMFRETDDEIELGVSPKHAGADLPDIISGELNRPFDSVAGPLMRATIIWASDGASIVLTFHHAIADALSGVRIIHDLMRALAGERLDQLPPLPPLEAVIAGSPTAPAMARDVAPRNDNACNAGERRWMPDGLSAHVSLLGWDETETDRLTRCCKAHGTTVHGAICAAAARHLPASDAGTVGIVSPMDARRIAGIETGGCGVFIGACTLETPSTSRGSLWKDSRDIVRGLQAARSPAAVAGMLHGIATLLPPTAGADRMHVFLCSQPQSAAVISNLGVLPLAEDYGPLKLKAVWGPAMLTNLPADRQTIGISTFAGRLRMVHQSYQPIPGLLQRVRKTLLEAMPEGTG
jgi:Condensation domain